MKNDHEKVLCIFHKYTNFPNVKKDISGLIISFIIVIIAQFE